MAKIKILTPCVTSKGIFKRGEYEVPEEDLRLFSPDYIIVMEAENRPKTASETREKKTARKKAVKK